MPFLMLAARRIVMEILRGGHFDCVGWISIRTVEVPGTESRIFGFHG
jgi:hypothetical protein